MLSPANPKCVVSAGAESSFSESAETVCDIREKSELEKSTGARVNNRVIKK
ncbi:MAG: hypothetical protein K8I03_13605 [Ignavibacteria bacterium]|nr:hypothetical protein [Ignavibacteria bacterium]